MNSSNACPRWWQLYLLFPILIALFIVDHQLRLSTHGHEVMQIGILLIVYGLVYWWLKANSIALSEMDRQKYYGRVTILQIHQLPEAKEERHPMFQLPSAEEKGMLSDTFEIETMHADRINEVAQEMKKE